MKITTALLAEPFHLAFAKSQTPETAFADLLSAGDAASSTARTSLLSEPPPASSREPAPRPQGGRAQSLDPSRAGAFESAAQKQARASIKLDVSSDTGRPPADLTSRSRGFEASARQSASAQASIDNPQKGAAPTGRAVEGPARPAVVDDRQPASHAPIEPTSNDAVLHPPLAALPPRNGPNSLGGVTHPHAPEADDDRTVSTRAGETSDKSIGAKALASQRAFGFDELGMFGLSSAPSLRADASSQHKGAAQAGPADPQRPQPTAPSNAVDSASPVSPAIGALPMADPIPSLTSVSVSDDVGVDAASLSPDRTIAETSPASPALRPAIATRREPQAPSAPTEERSSPAAPNGADKQDRSVQKSSADVNVLVADKSDDLHIVVASTQLDLAGALRLRKLTEEASADFGKKLRALSLNGRPIEPQGASVSGVQR